MNLMQAKKNNLYKIKKINIDDIEVESFLFSLGIYEGEEVLLLNKNNSNFTFIFNIFTHFKCLFNIPYITRERKYLRAFT